MGRPDGMGRPDDIPNPDGNNQDGTATDADNSDASTTSEESSSGMGPGPDGGTGVARRGAGGPDFLETDGTALPDTGEDALTDDSDFDTVEDIDEETDRLWKALNENNKISLYVRYVDLKTGKAENRLVNKNA